MKKTVLTMAIAIAALTAAAQEISFAKSDHDFGTIAKGSDASFEFTFVNTGQHPLILTGHTTTCGCTVPSYPKDKPIKPGEGGSIVVKYNRTDVQSPFDRAVTIKSNATNNPEARLRIRGRVQ